MTIVIGMKCTDGVVAASDSQSEFGRGVGVKRLNANKIYCADSKYLVAGAGLITHIRALVQNLFFALQEQRNRQRSELAEEECEDVIWRTLLAVNRRFNIERSGILGVQEPDFFKPLSVFGGKSQMGNQTSFFLFVLHVEGLVESVPDYATAGSGAAYAELLLKNLYWPEITTAEAAKVAAYVIHEVKHIDPNCGGSTNVGILTADGIANFEEGRA
ncbi:MAG: hypothetical protein V3V91_04520, partial [Thermoplasmata archaeon]